MFSQYKDVLGIMSLIVLLFSVSFSRISLSKLPYWTISLALIYYSLAYKFSLNKFDKIVKRNAADTQKIILGYILAVYAGANVLLKTALCVSYFVDPNNPFFNDKIIKKELLAYKDNDSNLGVVIFESVFEIFILVNTIIFISSLGKEKGEAEIREHSQSESVKNGNDNGNIEIIENVPNSAYNEVISDPEVNQQHNNDLLNNDQLNNEQHNKIIHNSLNLNKQEFQKVYNQYKFFQTNKFYFYILQFFLISIAVIFNVTIVNLPNFIAFAFLALFAVFHSYKYLDLTNKIFSFFAFISLIFHFTKNVEQFKNESYDSLLGIVNFSSFITSINTVSTTNTNTFANYSTIYFTFFFLSYLNSCTLQKYNVHEKELNSCLNDITENKQSFNKENHMSVKFLKVLKQIITKISSLCYNILLLFSILFHVCILMFINFLFIFFSTNKTKSNKWFLVPSFMVSLLFLSAQFIFNMSGMFLFSNTQLYKWLEIVGVSKYYKNSVSSDYSNITVLDESNEGKVTGMCVDVALVIFLTVFGCGMNNYYKKESKKELVESEEGYKDSKELKESKRSKEWVIFGIEKSYIFCLIFLFGCSIVKFDFLHVIYFFFFIMLLSVTDVHFRSVWDFLLLVNSIIIIIVLYFWNILALNFLGLESETNPHNEDLFSYLGLKINKNSFFILEYWEHILLYLFGYIHNYIINNSQDKFVVKNLYKFPEWSRYVALTLSVILMILLAVIKPLSFQGLFFLCFCLVFITAYMFILSVNKMDVIKTLIKLMILFSVILIIMKYSINFSFLVKYVTDKFDLEDSAKSMNSYMRGEDQEDTGFYNDSDSPIIKNFSLQDFGLDAMNLNFKLFINALLIIVAKILNSYKKYNGENNNQENNDNPHENEFSYNTSYLFNLNLNNTSEKVLLYLKIFLYQVIYLHSTKIMFILSVFICVSLESMMGVIFLGIILISLFLELRSGWKYSFFPLIFLSIIVMCFIYLCNLNAFKKWMTKDYEWFGLFNYRSNSTILSDLYPYLFIIFSAFLTRISSTFKHYYLDNEEMDQISRSNKLVECSDEDLSESRNLRSYENSEESNKEKGGIIDMKVRSSIVLQIPPQTPQNLQVNISSGSVTGNNTSYIKMNFSSISAISAEKHEDEIITTLSSMWNKIDYFWYLYGFYFVLVTIMLVAFIKVNILSLIFMTFVGFQSFGIYLRTEYLTRKEEDNAPNLKRIKKTWMIFASFLAIFTFFQYLNYMWFPPSWKIAKPWENLSFFCSKEGKTIYSNNLHYKNTSDYEYCVADWKAWLNIDNYSTKDIFFNFICLFLLLLSHKYFTNNEVFKRKRFEEDVETDFTITENRKELWAFVRYFLFIYLKSFILIYIIVISILYSYRYTNLIYGGFMFISFYLLFKDAALVKQKNNLWKYVQYYNYLVLVAFMLFQTPFLPCPVNRDGRSYIGLEECVEEENRLYQSFLLYEYPKNKVDALYMVMVQTIGVLKLDFKLLVVGNLSLFLIYIVALCQQIIFEHPYQSIVDKFYFREKQINCKSRAFKFVQESHLNTHTEYRQLFTFMEILKGKLERLGKKIIEYGDLWKKSYEFLHNDDNDKLIKYEERDSLYFSNKFKDEIDVMVDELFSSDKNLAGLLDYKVVKETTEVIRKNKVKEFISNLKENTYTVEEREEKEKKMKDEVLEELIYELKKLFAEQYVKDKLYLYVHKDHGLHIALDIFKKMVLEESKNPLVISSTKKDIELLKKLFVINKVSMGSSNLNNESNVGNVGNTPNNNISNIIEEKQENLCVDKEKLLLEREEDVVLIHKHEEIEIPSKDEIHLLPTPDHHLNSKENINANHYLSTDPQYHAYIKKLNFKPILHPVEEKEFSLYHYLKKQLWKSIDKILLIDLISNKKTKLTNIFELLFFSFYTNIEIFLVIAFIIHHCLDASIMSMVYPISYFGYGLVEYPVSNKYYWKAMTVYAIITITIKLVYQFPFFCGYPFLAVFNVFNDNYCEYYPLNDQEIAEGFEFILGLRKYNGEYSYPKNAGLLSGILWDIIIICLLLVMRSLLKSKGIWNFVNINKEFSKVPAFEFSKVIPNVELQTAVGNNQADVLNAANQNTADNQNNVNNPNAPSNYANSNPNNNYLSNLYSYWEHNLTLFFQRLVPELFSKDNFIIYKPGVDYYPLSFAALLTILIYTMFFFGSLTGKSGQGIQDALDKQQFSKELVWTVIILVSIIVMDRIIYKLRSINDEFIFEKFKKIEETHIYHIGNLDNSNNVNSGVKETVQENVNNTNNSNNISNNNSNNISNNNANVIPNNNANVIPNTENKRYAINSLNASEKDHIETSNLALMIKLVMHYLILIGAHILIFFVIPLSTRICFFNNYSLIVLYLLCCIYFYFSSKQIKYGFPLVTKGQYFADSTKLSNRILFKIYRNVPFLYELRAILDWTITKTSLDLFQFFKMECAYANLYEVKCDMDMRKGRRMGEDRWWIEKVSWGFCSFIFLMFILILPMILFSSFNPNLVENKVVGGTFKINLELKSSDTPHVTTYNLNLFDVSTLKINSLKDPAQYDYLKTYLVSQLDDLEERKVQKVKVVNYSQMDWILSPPAINALLKHLEKKTECYINIEWDFRREYPINNKNIMGEKSIKLNREQIATLRNIIFALKNHQKPETYTLEIIDAFPKVIRLSNRQWNYLKFDPKHKTPHKENTDLQIQLIKDNERDIYWKIHQVDIKDIKNSPFFQKNDELTFLLINDDVISSFFGFNSDGSMPLSIIGIYATLVYTVGKFVRIFFDKISQRVIYEEMPEPNDLFELCEGIYIYRNQRKLKEENYLYDLLIRIYRSPETLLKITGTKIKYLTDKPEISV